MQNNIIEFKNFSFQYDAQAEATIKNINLKIEKGEKILVLGPSGSGKSTLASCINGLIPFSYDGKIEGELFVNGIATKTSSISELSKSVGTVLQDSDGQFIGLTVAEDIAFALENDNVEQEEMFKRTKESAAFVGIETHLEHSPHRLSGGQKQRVSIAGVLVDKVDIFIFDEPLANLDPATGKHAIELIDNLQKDTDSTIVIIEHRLEDVLHRTVDRIVLMFDGEIIADMTPDEMLATTLLRDHGIREPLYLGAMRYAGCEFLKEDKPESIETMQVEKFAQKIKTWLAKPTVKQIKTEDEVLLDVKNLDFSYDENKQILYDITFKINKGEMLSIVGQNGAGKSTLSKVICGFEIEDAGDILLDGNSLLDESIRERAEHIGFVLQNPNQMISKNGIFEEVALGLVTRGLPKEEIERRVNDTLKICGLYPFRTWPISALSFGQKKRVTIAAVLVLSPEIIILDEPTAGQDFKHYTEIMEFLRELNKDGVTVIMITHDMHLMLEYTNRALVFKGGRLVADETPAKVLSDMALVNEAALKETSLYHLATRLGEGDPAEFAQHFIDVDREVRG